MSEFGTMRAQRRLADFSAQVTVEEAHNDTLTITDHPVEQGAAITDHAFKNPADLTLTVGWSNSGTDDPDYVRQVYADLLELQESREPFEVTTGKRLYKDMLISSLGTVTNSETENSLICVVTMRQVIIVETQTTTVPPREVQAMPEKTAETTNAGAKSATPAKSANTSALKDIFG